MENKTRGDPLAFYPLMKISSFNLTVPLPQKNDEACYQIFFLYFITEHIYKILLCIFYLVKIAMIWGFRKIRNLELCLASFVSVRERDDEGTRKCAKTMYQDKRITGWYTLSQHVETFNLSVPTSSLIRWWSSQTRSSSWQKALMAQLLLRKPQMCSSS